MGVSSTARLPTLSAQSIPALFSHLQTTSNAKVVTRWSITIRSFRAVPVPTNAYPRDDETEAHATSTSSSWSSSGGAGNASATSDPNAADRAGSGGGPTQLTKPRTMWQIWLSDYPGLVFVIVEDSGKVSRARVWREWELNKKMWRKEKRAEIRQAKLREEREKGSQASSWDTKTEAAQQQAEPSSTAELKGRDESVPAATDDPTATNAIQQEGESGTDDAMQVDEAATTQAQAAASSEQASEGSQTQLGSSTQSQSQDATGSSQPQPSSQPPATSSTENARKSPTGEAEDVVMPDEAQPIVKPAGPTPRLKLPIHTRLTLSVMTASLPTLLSKLNLPPPHGAPVGTAGPGAWVPRGAAVSIEGLVLDIGHYPTRPSSSSASSVPSDAAGFGTTDWRVRVGSVVGGGGRSAGAVIEAEFLPLDAVPPSATFLTDFLRALLPSHFGPLTPSLIGGTGQLAGSANAASSGAARTGSATAHGLAYPARSANALGLAPPHLGGGSSNATLSASGSGNVPTNGTTVSVPTISDQLWEEVVPRSADSWRRMISHRSQRLEASRRRAKSANPAPDPESEHPPRQPDGHDEPKPRDPFTWHTACPSSPSRDEAALDASTDLDPLLLSDTDTEPDAPPSTDAPLAPAEDSDDDDDKPLGLLTALAQQSATANLTSNPPAPVATPNPAAASSQPNQASKNDDGIRLHFEGLRASWDEEEGQPGWSGVERGRRMAFNYVQMLRAEGII